MREEIGEEARVERLLWTVESLFLWQGRPQHELGLYFLMSFPEGSRAYSDTFGGNEEGVGLFFEWHRIQDLDALTVYPTFLRTCLRALSAAPEHIVDISQ